SLKVLPTEHFENWQQDPQGNWLLRCVFPKKVREFSVEVDLVTDMTVINPFDFFIEEAAEKYPFNYDEALQRELRPYLETLPVGPKLAAWIAGVDATTKRRTIDFLIELNQRLPSEIEYCIRLEPGIQSPEETLELAKGSCRDSAWLLVQILRHFGLAARFVSGYSIQLTADIKALDGPSGVAQDVCDLHAWAEVYLPGAGWIGMDATSGLLTGEGHIPLAATPDPTSAAPIAGAIGEKCECEFDVRMTVTRIHEDPRVTKPYTDQEWTAIEALGHKVDERLKQGDVRLTMGGEPTFVSIDDMEGEEWNTAAVGPTKRKLADKLMKRLKGCFAPGGLLHYGQGKWYPGESLPRWAFGCYWRRDGQPVWLNPELFADEEKQYGFDWPHAEQFARRLTERLSLDPKWVIPAYEDAWYYLWRERRLPTNVDPLKSKLEDKEERTRLANIFERGLGTVKGHVLPLTRVEQPDGTSRWATGPWFMRQEHMFLIPGDSPIGFRLPLDSLPYLAPADRPILHERDPAEARSELPPHPAYARHPFVPAPAAARHAQSAVAHHVGAGGGHDWFQAGDDYEHLMETAAWRQRNKPGGNGHGHDDHDPRGNGPQLRADHGEHGNGSHDPIGQWWRGQQVVPSAHDDSHNVVRTAICVEPRDGRLHIFMPPAEKLEDYLDLVATIEATAAELDRPVVIEGYLPPHDPRITHIKVTPDPGVIEVNVQPAASWDEAVHITKTVYEEARQTRLGTEKFNLDGRHAGTGGGNHVVLGGATPKDSPFLRRPDLLRSLVGYWINHPSLSYMFSGMFIGPTSQAPRVD
ncbi:MAG TPA: transglutaminase family protein, partial [Pirellulaceae bacterium]|nr:transglutaminase family protein [Pirellulaceae bacterium]